MILLAEMSSSNQNQKFQSSDVVQLYELVAIPITGVVTFAEVGERGARGSWPTPLLSEDGRGGSS